MVTKHGEGEVTVNDPLRHFWNDSQFSFLLDLAFFLSPSFRFQSFKVWKLRDLGSKFSSEQILELPGEGGDSLIPPHDIGGESFDITVLEEAALVMDLDGKAKLGGKVEQTNDREVALQKVLDAASFGVTGILSLTER